MRALPLLRILHHALHGPSDMVYVVHVSTSLCSACAAPVHRCKSLFKGLCLRSQSCTII